MIYRVPGWVGWIAFGRLLEIGIFFSASPKHSEDPVTPWQMIARYLLMPGGAVFGGWLGHLGAGLIIFPSEAGRRYFDHDAACWILSRGGDSGAAVLSADARNRAPLAKYIITPCVSSCSLCSRVLHSRRTELRALTGHITAARSSPGATARSIS